MKSNQSLLKRFLIITTFFASGVFLWLVLTTSKSDAIFFLLYNKQRFIIISLFAFILFVLLILLLASNNQRLQNIFDKLMASTIIHFLFTITTIIFLVLLCEILLFLFGSGIGALKRATPIIVFGLLFSLEVILYQDIYRKLNGESSFFAQDKDEYILTNGRDLRLDFLRGFFVLVMVIDHIGGWSILYNVTFGNEFFTSAAEGFLLVSGIVTGLVYSKVVKAKGISGGFVKSAGRILSLYLVAVGLSMLILFFQEHFSLYFSSGVDLSQPFQPILNLLLFRDLYRHGEILVLYCYMFMFLPYAILLLESNKTKWLIGICSVIYGLNVLFPGSLLIQIDTFMSIGGIQLIFFGGLILGWRNNLQKVQDKINLKWLLISGFSFLLLIFLWNFLRDPGIFPFLDPSNGTLAFLDSFFAKAYVAPGRVLSSIIVFGFLYIFITLVWKEINKLLGWLILPLGAKALFAYAAHVILFILSQVLFKIFGYDRHSNWLNLIFQVIAVLIIWYLIRKDLFTPKARNKKLYYLSPAIILLVIVSFEFLYTMPQIQSVFDPIFNLAIGH